MVAHGNLRWLFLYREEEGHLSRHRCVLAYESGTEAGHEKPTSERTVPELSTTMLEAERREEMEACCGRQGLQETAGLPCAGKVEGVRSFLEESSGEQDSGSGTNEVITC